MKQILKKIAQRIWHDFYIVLSFTILRPLAMTCRQAALYRDTNYDKAERFARIKYYLHLSICTPCSNYLRLTEYLEKSMANYQIKTMTDAEVKEFNHRLIKQMQKI